ncbi:MAG TPA: hypothetical protein VHD15_15395 [Hyphomicrobiales bacterium]|nr:hypothetical protein [Hyphomicrobiales bacterium]
MVTRILAAGAFLLASTALALAAGPVGTYSVKGTNPGKPDSPYSGTVTVTQTGDTYRVKWEIGDDSYTGTGIGSDKFLAVTYSGGDDQTGLALYAPNASGVWEGIWTYAGSKTIGTESWTAK